MKAPQKAEAFKKTISDYMESQIKAMGFADISKANTRSRGMAFLKFYLCEVFSQFIDIDEEEIESGIVDKKNDLGIDFIHIVDNEIHIIQSKYGKSSVGKEEYNHFVQLPNLIYQQKYTKKAHAELKAILNEAIKIKNPILKLTLITNSKLSQNDIDFYENTPTTMDVVYSILGFSQLRQEFARVESLNNLPPDEVSFNLGNEDYMEIEEAVEEGDYPTVVITL